MIIRSPTNNKKMDERVKIHLGGTDTERWATKEEADKILAYLDKLHSPPKKLTQEDLNNINYFWKGYRDLERWTEWEKLKPSVGAEYPEIINGWNSYQASIKAMDMIIKNATQHI